MELFHFKVNRTCWTRGRARFLSQEALKKGEAGRWGQGRVADLGQPRAGHSTRVRESQCGGVTATVTARPVEKEDSRAGVEEPDFWNILLPHTHLFGSIPHSRIRAIRAKRAEGLSWRTVGKRWGWFRGCPGQENEPTRVLFLSIFLPSLPPATCFSAKRFQESLLSFTQQNRNTAKHEVPPSLRMHMPRSPCVRMRLCTCADREC